MKWLLAYAWRGFQRTGICLDHYMDLCWIRWIYPVDNWISCPFNFERKQNLSVQFPGASSLTRGLTLSFGCGEHYWLSLKSKI
jgi:hypothetical protein